MAVKTEAPLPLPSTSVLPSPPTASTSIPVPVKAPIKKKKKGSKALPGVVVRKPAEKEKDTVKESGKRKADEKDDGSAKKVKVDT